MYVTAKMLAAECHVSEKTILERLDAIENKLKVMDEKLTRDYERINTVEREQKNVRKAQNKSLEERGIIMRALLALMEGSEESEKIRESENEINSYLIKQAHQGEELYPNKKIRECEARKTERGRGNDGEQEIGYPCPSIQGEGRCNKTAP